jgi:bifunctional DNase/RNase
MRSLFGARIDFPIPRDYPSSRPGNRGGDSNMDIRMDLARIVIQDTTDQQIIFLRERDGEREFPIVIGDSEAYAIDRRLKGFKKARPMTHDLMADIIERLGGDLEKIVISDLKNHTFYAKLVIRANGEMIEIDSRPSDAIALGVANSETPIFVSEHVLREVLRQ